MNRTIIISQAAILTFLAAIFVGFSNLSFVGGNAAGSEATDLLIAVFVSAATAGVFLARAMMMQGWRNANPAKRKQAKRAMRPSGIHWELPGHCL